MISPEFVSRELKPTEVIAWEKSQGLRLIDVFVLGPMLVWVGLQKEVPEWVKPILVVTGALTIAYNWRNYSANVRGANVSR